MTPAERKAAFRELAKDLEKIDLDVYTKYGEDPFEPTLGPGEPSRAVAIFGRDPGRHEIEHRQPFVGVGGQKIRKGLYKALNGAEMPDFEASLAIGNAVFWANTVPYKPLGNKAWSVAVKKAFQPIVTDLLVNGWQGRDVLCMGSVAFMWFGLNNKEATKRLKAHWALEKRFESSIDISLTAPDGNEATFHLHPLPHPSPLNATWAPHFPGLLAKRLSALHFGTQC